MNTYNEKNRAWINLLLPAGVDRDHLRLLVPANLPAPLPPVVIPRDLLELRKLKIHDDMSQETMCFSAEVWYKGKKVAIAINEGHGGTTDVRATDVARCKEAEAWATSLPPMSSYQRVYDAVLDLDAAFAKDTAEQIRAEWWFNTRAMSLERLVDDIAAVTSNRKSLARKADALVAVGPGAQYISPVVLQNKQRLEEAHLLYYRGKYGWAVRFQEFLNLPHHYYPAPHPFAHRWNAKIRCLSTGQVGKIGYGATTDHQVELVLEKGSVPDHILCHPCDVEFVTESAAVSQLVEA